MPPGQVNVEHQRERAGHKDLVLVQFGHRYVQRFSGVGFGGVERDPLDLALGFHLPEGFLGVSWKKVLLHRHRAPAEYFPSI